jgi:hypothetical protein
MELQFFNNQIPLLYNIYSQYISLKGIYIRITTNCGIKGCKCPGDRYTTEWAYHRESQNDGLKRLTFPVINDRHSDLFSQFVSDEIIIA